MLCFRPLDPRDGIVEPTGRAKRRVYGVPKNEVPDGDLRANRRKLQRNGVFKEAKAVAYKKPK